MACHTDPWKMMQDRIAHLEEEVRRLGGNKHGIFEKVETYVVTCKNELVVSAGAFSSEWAANNWINHTTEEEFEEFARLGGYKYDFEELDYKVVKLEVK